MWPIEKQTGLTVMQIGSNPVKSCMQPHEGGERCKRTATLIGDAGVSALLCILVVFDHELPFPPCRAPPSLVSFLRVSVQNFGLVALTIVYLVVAPKFILWLKRPHTGLVAQIHASSSTAHGASGTVGSGHLPVSPPCEVVGNPTRSPTAPLPRQRDTPPSSLVQTPLPPSPPWALPDHPPLAPAPLCATTPPSARPVTPAK